LDRLVASSDELPLSLQYVRSRLDRLQPTIGSREQPIDLLLLAAPLRESQPTLHLADLLRDGMRQRMGKSLSAAQRLPGELSDRADGAIVADGLPSNAPAVNAAGLPAGVESWAV